MADERWRSWIWPLAIVSCATAIVIAVSAYHLGWLSGEQDGRQIEASTVHERNAKKEIGESCGGLDHARMFECVYDGVTTSKEEEYSEQDLTAQQGMHFWAVLMATATMVQTLVAGFALYFLIKDLRQNRSSAERQLRANLAISPLGITSLIASPHVLGQVLLRNVGNTLAKNVCLEVNIEICVGKSKDDFPVGGDPGQVPRALHSGDEMSQGSKNALLLNDVRAPDNYIFVWGIAYYDDGFDQRRFTRFCHRYHCASHDRLARQRAGAKKVTESQIIIGPAKARLHEAGNDAS